MRARSRHSETARPRFDESSQKPPRATSEKPIITTALIPTRPVRRTSRNVSLSTKPSTGSAVLDQAAALEHERPLLEALGQCRLVRGQDDGGAPGPDVLDHVEQLRRHRVVDVGGGL